MIARTLLTRGADLRNGVLAFAVFGLPMALAFLWLEPVVQQTIPVSPNPAQLAQNLHHYRADLVVHSLARYSLAPARIDRNGAVAVVALAAGSARAARPATALERTRARRHGRGARHRALAARLPALLQPRLAVAVAARCPGSSPSRWRSPAALAIISRFSRTLALVGALACGIWLQVAYAGDFGLRAPKTEPAIVVWIALYGGIAALVAGAVLAWRRCGEPSPAGSRAHGGAAALAVSPLRPARGRPRLLELDAGRSSTTGTR